jgi:hypothetical protein
MASRKDETTSLGEEEQDAVIYKAENTIGIQYLQ